MAFRFAAVSREQRRNCPGELPLTRRVKAAGVIAALVFASQIAAAQQSVVRPAKPVRVAPPIAIPQTFAPPQEAYASLPEKTAGAPQAASACQLRLAKSAVFRPLPPLVGPGECGAADAVLLETVILPDQTKISLSPPATLRCTMAEQIVAWVRDDVAPAALKLGAPLHGLDNYDSYECRGRNRVRGATLSEHGRANALDVRGFRLANGLYVGLTDVKVAKAWREGIRSGVCARFSTVLGPGSDGAHEEHIHLDLAERRGGYKLCEWDVREPAPVMQQSAQPGDAPQSDGPETTAAVPEAVPLPRPRPRAANAVKNLSRMPLRGSERM